MGMTDGNGDFFPRPRPTPTPRAAGGHVITVIKNQPSPGNIGSESKERHLLDVLRFENDVVELKGNILKINSEIIQL